MDKNKLCAILFYDNFDIDGNLTSSLDSIKSLDEFEIIVKQYVNGGLCKLLPSLKWAKLFDEAGNEVIFWNGKEFLGGY